MKSLFAKAILFVSSAFILTGCATVFGGPRTSYQVTKPRDGEPQREIRVGALIADIILFLPGTIVDFATGAIYRPAPLKSPVPVPPPVNGIR
ncbi:hypothetical protein [Spirosoma pomorum]